MERCWSARRSAGFAPRGRGSSGSVSTVAGGDLGTWPPPRSSGTAAWPSTDPRRQSRPLSGSLSPFPTHRSTPGYPQNPEKCPSTPFSQRPGSARSAAPVSAWTRNRRHPGAAVGLLSRVDYRCLPQGHRSRSPPQPQHQLRRAAGLGIRTRHGRQAPLPDRQRTPRRQSRPLSGPLSVFPTCRGTPGHPQNPEKCPSTPFSQRRWLRALRRAGVPLDPQSKIPGCGRRVAEPSRLPLPAAGPPVEVAAAAASMSTVAPPVSALGPATAVRHRRLAVSGTPGVRVGLSADP